MTVAAALQNRIPFGSDANLVSKKYNITLSGTYTTGGMTVDEDVLTTDAQKMNKIFRAYFDQGQSHKGNTRFEIVSINNTTLDNPSFKIKVYEKGTGETDESELTNGAAVSETFALILEGIDYKQPDAPYLRPEE